MQAELRAQRPDLDIEIHGVNAAGHEPGNPTVCAGRSTPWLQDTFAADVWGLWQVTFRDCIVLDETNTVVSIYNLTSHDLSVAYYYDELKALLISIAEP